MHLVATVGEPSADPRTGHAKPVTLANHECLTSPVADLTQRNLAVREEDTVTGTTNWIRCPIGRRAGSTAAGINCSLIADVVRRGGQKILGVGATSFIT